MQFYEPERFIFLWLIPAAWVLWKWGSLRRVRRLRRWGEACFLERRLMPVFSSSRRRWGAVLLLGVLFLSTLALARPQWGEEKKRLERKGVDLVFLLDTSLSMLAEDVRPSRLAKSKLEIKNLIRRLKGDRVGMVGFAGSAFLQCPLTLDYSAFLLFVDALKPGYLPTPGTSLSEAIRLGIRAFPEESRKYRALFIFSDGEDHEGGIDEALTEAKKAGVRIYTLGAGTPEGDPIPLRSGTDPTVTTGYKKDRNGQVVVTRLNAPFLTQIARETGGLYFQTTAGEKEIDLILKHLETMGERRLRERLVTEREDHFQVFILLALLLLLGESWFRNPRVGTEGGKAVFLLTSLMLFSGFLDSPRSLVQKGNEQAREKKYQSAVENYRKAQVSRPEESVIRYNLGTALYQLYEYRDAARELAEALAHAKEPATKAQVLYNYGNTQYRLGDFEKAIDSYKKALEVNPKDEDAKYNLEFLQKKKSNFEKKQEERQEQQKKNPQEQPQENQQQNQPQPQQNQRQQNQPQPQPSQGGEGRQDQQKQQGQQEQGREGGAQHLQEQQRQGEGEGKAQGRGERGDEGKEREPSQGEGWGQEKQQERVPQPQPGEQGAQEGASSQHEEQGPAQTESASQSGPLQGQMTQENALQILNVLREGEKQLQDVRRPNTQAESREVLKDW